MWTGLVIKTDSKSSPDNLFKIGKTPIQWYTKKQSCIAMPSAEAEYFSTASAAQEITLLLILLKDFDLN